MWRLFVVAVLFLTVVIGGAKGVEYIDKRFSPPACLHDKWETVYMIIRESRTVEDNCLLVSAYMARYKDAFPSLSPEGHDAIEAKLGATLPRWTMEPGFVRAVVPSGSIEVTVKLSEDTIFVLPTGE